MSESPGRLRTGPRREPRDGRSGSSETAGVLARTAGSVRRLVSSGVLAVVASGIDLLRALRAFRNGSSARAIRKGTMAAFWIAVAVAQRRSNRSGFGRPFPSGPVDQTCGGGTATEFETVSSGSKPGQSSQRSDTGSGATSIDVPEADPASDAGGDATSDVDRSDVADTEGDRTDTGGTGGVKDASDAAGMEAVEDADGVGEYGEVDGIEAADEAKGIEDVTGTTGGEESDDEPE